MTRNLKALYINEAYGVITMDDMDFGIKLGDIPSYTKQAKLMLEIFPLTPNRRS